MGCSVTEAKTPTTAPTPFPPHPLDGRDQWITMMMTTNDCFFRPVDPSTMILKKSCPQPARPPNFSRLGGALEEHKSYDAYAVSHVLELLEH